MCVGLHLAALGQGDAQSIQPETRGIGAAPGCDEDHIRVKAVFAVVLLQPVAKGGAGFFRLGALDGGAHDKGQIVAKLKVAGNERLNWFFDCHFQGDPVMPGCLGLDALWQLTGFYLGWLGAPGRGRALGVGEVKFTDMVVPTTGELEYIIDVKRVILRKLKLGIADGTLRADGKVIYTATDLRVGLFDATGD